MLQTATAPIVNKMTAITMEQILFIVRRRMDQKGYRPVLSTDRLRMNRNLLRVEVQRYYLSATVNDVVGQAPGTKFVTLRREHLTRSGLLDITRNEFDASSAGRNDFRWFVRKDGR